MTSEYDLNLIENDGSNKISIDTKIPFNSLTSNSFNSNESKILSANKGYNSQKRFIYYFLTLSLILFTFFLCFNVYNIKYINFHKNNFISFASDKKGKSNKIELKFTCKDPKLPILIFNSSSQIQNHIKSFKIGGKEENVTEYYTFGFSGKYKVSIELKDKITSLKNLFSGCSQLLIADFTDFDSDEITDMSGLFEGCLRLKYVEFGDFSTKKVISMANMFNGCKSLVELNLTVFDT